MYNAGKYMYTLLKKEPLGNWKKKLLSSIYGDSMVHFFFTSHCSQDACVIRNYIRNPPPSCLSFEFMYQ